MDLKHNNYRLSQDNITVLCASWWGAGMYPFPTIQTLVCSFVQEKYCILNLLLLQKWTFLTTVIELFIANMKESMVVLEKCKECICSIFFQDYELEQMLNVSEN